MKLEREKLGEKVSHALDWVYSGDRMPNMMVLAMCVAIAAQACQILDCGCDKEEPAAQPRVLSID